MWAAIGLVAGPGIGATYYLLCGYDFLVVTVAFPCLIGGVASVIFGNGNPSWLQSAPFRLGKGLVVGLALAFSYMFLLNILLNVAWLLLPPLYFPSTEEYVYMMWRVGPIAMFFASGLYFVLFRWSANLE